MKKVVKTGLIVLLAIVIILAAYAAYVLIDYHRLGSGPLIVSGKTEQAPVVGTSYDLLSWNIGFGAYTADYDFFMDGGTQSWAESPERLDQNMADICSQFKEESADFYLIQEVDLDATRSYHRNEYLSVVSTLGAEYSHTFCQNYDSPFLMYPLTEPHGASQSGILTLSRFDISNAQRVELPIETSLMKLLDLDRCYSTQCIPTEDGKLLYLFNFHLSAYTSDGTIATEQLIMLLQDMQRYYDTGAYCIAGGDFNKDLLGDSTAYFGVGEKEYSWAQPIPEEIFDSFSIHLAVPFDANNPVPSCRRPDSAYHEGQYVFTVDGFLVSDNVEVESCEVLDYGFAYSDHNPVRMNFKLK